MRNITVFALLLSLLFAVAIHATFAQTPPRRVEGPAPNPSPRPPASVAIPELERKSGDAVRATTGPSGTEEQKQGDVVRIDTNLVMVPVSVLDRNGRYITDLHREDFMIHEDGIEQEIAYFAAIEKPFTVVLVLDTSASTWSKLSEIKEAARAFVAELRPDDQVMVISFGMGVKVQCEPTSDRKEISKGIGATSRGLSTRLYDAMDQVMKKYLNRIQGRKAVVLFTDGVDATRNHATYESTVHMAEELDALVYSIRYDTYDPAADKGDVPDPTSGLRLPGILGKIPLPFPSIVGNSGGGAGSSRADYDRGERYLQKLAELTGGRVYEARQDLRDLQTAFSHIAEELGRQYGIGYYPKKKGEMGERRQIKVRIKRTDVAVRARDNYIYKGPRAVTQTPASASDQDKQTKSPPSLQKKPFVGDLKTPH
jgi:Ca-activated chloride channel family protein